MKDVGAELAVLSGLMNYGNEVFLDIDAIVSADTFTVYDNQIIFSCIKQALSKSDNVDVASIVSASTELGLYEHFSKQQTLEHLKDISQYPVLESNVEGLAKKIAKCKLIRDVQSRLNAAAHNLSKLTGNEPVDEIISAAESPLFELSFNLRHTEGDKTELIHEDLEDYVDYLADNPVDTVGLTSGYPIFDEVIGGGLRRKTVNLIGARMKQGKSMVGDNVAINVAKMGIPVLMLDSEMDKKDHIHRLLANLTQVNSRLIENGKFGLDKGKKERVYMGVSELKNLPYYYRNIAGKPFNEVLSIIKRWIIKDVGFDEEGVTNDCLVVYDYFKLMSKDDLDVMSEFQALGFQVNDLHNFSIQYDFPCLAFVQLNRDGIDQETTSVIAQSDRLAWACTSISLWKTKTDEEMAQDGFENGNKKLVSLACRHGGGMDSRDYINFNMDGATARISELGTKMSTVKREDDE